MSFRFFLWSLRKQDWMPIIAIGIGVTCIGYSAYDYQRTYHREKYMPSPKQQPQNPGRFGQSFPETKQEYKTQQTKQLSLEEIEWQLQQRQERYDKFIENN